MLHIIKPWFCFCVAGVIDCEDEFSYDMGPDPNSMFLDGTYQVIKWQAFQASKWAVLLDERGNDL